MRSGKELCTCSFLHSFLSANLIILCISPFSCLVTCRLALFSDRSANISFQVQGNMQILCITYVYPIILVQIKA